MMLSNKDLLWLICHLLSFVHQVAELTMLTMRGMPREPFTRPSSSTKLLDGRLNSPASWTLWPWSPLTTRMCLHLEETPPEETQFLVLKPVGHSRSCWLSVPSCVKCKFGITFSLGYSQVCLVYWLRTRSGSQLLFMETDQAIRSMELVLMWMRRFQVSFIELECWCHLVAKLSNCCGKINSFIFRVVKSHKYIKVLSLKKERKKNTPGNLHYMKLGQVFILPWKP